MSLILFSMVMLSTLFSIIFGFWWDSSAPFNVHVAALATILTATVSAIIVLSVYPRLRYKLSQNTGSKLDDIDWGKDISSKLSSPAAVIDGYNIKFANNAFLKELGLKNVHELIQDMPITNLVHPSNHSELTQLLSQHDDSNQMLTLRMLYVDGTTIPVHMSFSQLNRDQHPNMKLLQFSLTSAPAPGSDFEGDESQQHALLARIQQVVFQINVDHELIFVNQAWERLLDYSIEDTLGKTLLDFVHPEDIPLAEARLHSLTEGKRQKTQFELRLIAKNGMSQWFDMHASTSSQLKGERSSIIGTLTDISRMKQTTAALKANARSSTEMILSRIPAMIYRCKNDRNWSLEYVSNGCVEVTEYQPYELVKTPSTSYMELIHPDDQSFCWEHVQHQLAKQLSYQMIYRLISRSGKTRWVYEQGRGVFSGSDELLALEGIITELRSDDYRSLQNGLNDMLKAQAIKPG
jgi:PAS domain S-box-containing protein